MTDFPPEEQLNMGLHLIVFHLEKCLAVQSYH